MAIFISQAAAAAPPALPSAADQLKQLENQATQLQSQQGTTIQVAPTSWWSVTDAMTISAVVLVFGAVTILVAAYLIRNERDSQVILKVLATILIISFSVFLIVAGYSDQQIAPAMGLLGTIAGYLLGKDTGRALSQTSDTRPTSPAG